MEVCNNQKPWVATRLQEKVLESGKHSGLSQQW
jgi:hypothetical protein